MRTGNAHKKTAIFEIVDDLEYWVFCIRAQKYFHPVKISNSTHQHLHLKIKRNVEFSNRYTTVFSRLCTLLCPS